MKCDDDDNDGGYLLSEDGDLPLQLGCAIFSKTQVGLEASFSAAQEGGFTT